MSRSIMVALMVLGPLAWGEPALAGGGLDASDVPAPHAAPVASIAAVSTGGSDVGGGCPPFEARSRAIGPRPRLSASALLTRAAN